MGEEAEEKKRYIYNLKIETPNATVVDIGAESITARRLINFRGGNERLYTI